MADEGEVALRVAEGAREQGGMAFTVLLGRAVEGTEPSAAEAAHDMAWEQLHSGPWHEVHHAWRDGYALSCLYWARELRRSGKYAEAMRVLDMGLMMGGSLVRPSLNAAITSLQAVEMCQASIVYVPEERKSEDGEQDAFQVKLESLPRGSLQSGAIRKVSFPSLEDFLCEHFVPGIPVIVTGAMTHWPAMMKWKDSSYFNSIAGSRTVPVEVGENYLADGWKQELMTMSQFLARMYASECATTRPYLAQHPLFEQIPELQQDIVVPDYCACGGGELHSINAWFGPTGTVTPAHHDPHHNLLAQVVGKKYVRLYSPGVSEFMYPYSEKMLHNSSQVDLDKPDYERFPMAKNLSFTDCVLQEGEMLYIPPKWWHYVKSLSPSLSVSFWWRDIDAEHA